MGTEVNEIINNICDKLGILASELIPEMSKMKIAELGVTIVIITLILIGAIIMLIIGAKQLYADEFSESGQALMFIGGFLGVVVLIAVIVIVPEFIGWIVSPKAKSFAYVLEKIGG